MMKPGRCVRCGRSVGIKGREHCARCYYALAHRPAKNQCPGCGKAKQLEDTTGQCVLCSLADLHPLRREDRTSRPRDLRSVPGQRPAGRSPAALPPVRQTRPDP